MSRKFCVVMMAVVGLVFCSQVFGQMVNPPEVEWEKTFGGARNERASSVQQTTDGGYIVAGETLSFGAGGYDVYLVKTDTLGNLVWQKTFGGANFDWGRSVQQTKDGGYIVAGSTSSFSAGNGDVDVYLVKTDVTGTMVWHNWYGEANLDYGYSVQQTSDGGYIVAGKTYSFGAVWENVYLVKTDSLGNMVWQKTFGGTSHDIGYSVQQTTDGGYIVAGETSSFGAGSGVYLIKTDASGNDVWQQTHLGAGGDIGYSVQQTTDGGYIVAGETSFGLGWENVYLVKTDSLGNKLWQNTYGGARDDWGNSVQQTTDGGYVVAGPTWSFGAGDWDVYLVKTDSLGNMVWQQTYAGANNDIGYSVQQTTDGGYIVAGETYSFGTGDWDVYLIKLAPESQIPPFSPSEISAQLRTPQSAGISWQDNSANETGFVLERRSQALGGTGENEWQAIAQAPANTTMYIDSVLPPNHEATYRIAAKNANGISPKVISQPITTPDSRWQLKIYDSVSDKWVDLKSSDDPKFHKDWGTAVIVHGWNPSKNSSFPFNILHWDGDINTNQKGETFWVLKIADAIDKRMNHRVNVLAWDWLKEATTDTQPESYKHVRDQSQLLADTLKQAIPDGYEKPIHLMGHSNGSYIVTLSGLELLEPSQVSPKTLPVKQVTLWDPPDWSLILVWINLKNHISRLRAHDVYVDFYHGITSLETQNANIWVNVPCILILQGICHSITYEWYMDTIPLNRNPQLRNEPNSPFQPHCLAEVLDGTIGFGASILVAPPNNPNFHRVKIAQCQDQGTLMFSKLSLCSVITGEDVFGLDGTRDCIEDKPPIQQTSPNLTQGSFSFSVDGRTFSQGCFCNANTTEAILNIGRQGQGGGAGIEGFTARYTLELDIEPEWDFMNFEYDFLTSPAPSELEVSLVFGNEVIPVFLINSEVVFNEEYQDSGLQDIKAFHGRRIRLQIDLRSTEPGASIGIRNLTFWKDQWNGNNPPTAHAGEDQMLMVECGKTATITLDGSLTSDQDKTDTLQYWWMYQGELIADGIQPTIELQAGTYLITLVVRDQADNVSTDGVRIVIRAECLFIRGDSNTNGALNYKTLSNHFFKSNKTRLTDSEFFIVSELSPS